MARIVAKKRQDRRIDLVENSNCHRRARRELFQVRVDHIWVKSEFARELGASLGFGKRGRINFTAAERVKRLQSWGRKAANQYGRVRIHGNTTEAVREHDQRA